MSCDVNGISAQGTKLFVKKTDETDFVEVGSITALGNLSDGERTVIETELLSCNDVAKSLGSIKRGSIDVTYLYNEDLPDGHGKLDEAKRADGTIYLDARIELSNAQTADGYGTQFDFGVIVPKVDIIDFSKDNMIKAQATLSITSEATVTKST